MLNGWHSVALDDVAELSGGYAFKSEEYAPSGRFVLRTLNIGDDGRIHREQAKYISLEACEPYKRFELRPNDVLFVMVGATLGKVGLVTQRDLPALLNQNMWRIRAIDGAIDERFLYYAFKHCAASGLGGASGSARLFVRRDDYRRLQIPIAPMAHQQAVGSMLRSLDDKIDLNRRMNETLEAMARAIFKDWFVDFNPTRAKMDGRAPYLSPSIWRLFPTQLNNSQLGLIPSGWSVLPLGEVCKRITDGAHASPKSVPDGLPMASVKDMTNWGIDVSGCRRISELDYADLVRNGCRPLAGDVLIAKDGSYLKHIFVVPRDLDLVVLSSIAILRPNDRIDPHFLNFALRSDVTTALMKQYVSGAVLQRIVLRDFKKLPLVIPSCDLLEHWRAVVEPLMHQVWLNEEEAFNLAKTRDLLLPKLMSGEIRVKDAEKIVEAAP